MLNNTMYLIKSFMIQILIFLKNQQKQEKSLIYCKMTKI
jgi:hypothetical protein